jgi:peptidoglycan/xylan/chitin deacetylase (PgdA/CDA1 family)
VSSSISSYPEGKRRLARFTRWTALTSIAGALDRRRRILRVVNCHSVPERYTPSFSALVRQLSRKWTLAAPADLPGLLQRRPDGPSLLFCFDDGLANTVEIAAPILEAAGARAIFAVPAAWPDVPMGHRAGWFEQHVYPVPTELHDREGDVSAPTWDALRKLIARGHEVWSHGFDHVQLRDDTPVEVLEREIVDSKARLEERLGFPVRGYCPPIGYTVPASALALIEQTYELAFGGPPHGVPRRANPTRIPRSNIEASWPSDVVDFQLSPLGDLMSHALARMRR